MGATKVKPNDLFTYQKISFINVYDFTFDSKLEFYCFHSFMLNKIKFIFKPKFILQDKILSGKKVSVKAITISPDFELLKDGNDLALNNKQIHHIQDLDRSQILTKKTNSFLWR